MPKPGAPNLDLQRARVLSIASEVETWLGMAGQYRIVHLFNENELDSDALAMTVGKSQYRYAEITWNLYTVMAAEDPTLYRTAIHELIHVLTCGVDKYLPHTKPYVVEANELAVESITYAIVSALRTPPPEALG